jgi:hypothetical protein
MIWRDDVIEKASSRSPRETEPRGKSTPIMRLFELHGERVAKRSNLVKAVEALREIEDGFTVPRLSSVVGMPPSKGYLIIKRLLAIKIVEALPKVERPPDWGEYSLGMRKRFYEEHGIRYRGRDPQRYRHCPSKALALLRERVQEDIERIDEEATDRINALLEEYEEIGDALTRRVEEAHASRLWRGGPP